MKRSVWACLTSFSFGSALYAQQSSSSVAIGDYVRFNVIPASADTLRCEARISRLLLDTLLVRPVGRCALLNPGTIPIRDLELEKRFSSRSARVAVSGIIGIIVGALAGVVIAGDGCQRDGCSDGSLAVAGFGLTGAFAGALIGTAVGFFLPAGSQWVRSPDRPVRFDW